MTPNIETARLGILPFAHAPEASVRWLNDPILTKFSEQRHRQHTIETQQKYVDSFDHHNSHLWFLVTADMEVVGSVTAYRDRYNGTADIGILVAKGGKGLGTEAFGAVCGWLIVDGVRKLEAGCMKSNIGMVRILEKCGFTLEGVRKAHFILDHAPEDLVQYGRFN